ncbi:MAG TPA: GNAT family N-acetyltransferase [Acidimicrobiales bacterium]|nr:GNAT family N-acetyltransferase [Acidimicrobiales bacterium]
MVHRLIGPDERTTVVSAHSLGARCGGIVTALALGPVAERAGVAWAMLVPAGLLASAAPLYRIAGRHAGPVASADIGFLPLASSDMATEVRDVPARTRYEITLDGELAGFAEYREVDGARVFTHTEVFDAFEGRGVGSALARGALDQVRAGIGRAVALCPFIAGFVEQHDEYADLLDPALDRRLRDEAGRK